MSRYLFFVTQLYSFAILRPLQEAIRARGDEVAWYLHNIDRENLQPDEKLLDSVNAVKSYDPAAVYVPTNWVPDFFPGAKVQIFHGLANDATGKKGHFRIRGLFDLYCTHAEPATRIFENLARQHANFHVTETGWPKLDPLFRNEQMDLQQYRPRDDRAVVLYGSTFSPSLTSAPVLLDTIRELSRRGDWHRLVTLHPKMDPALVAEYRALEGANLQFIESSRDLMPALKAADVMVCDTSSISLEFMLLDKPVVTFRTRTPGEHVIDVTDTREIAPAIARALTRPEQLMTAGRRYIDQLHPYRDGHSSERVLQATDEFIREHAHRLKPKPLNLWRKLQARKWLGYYRL